VLATVSAELVCENAIPARTVVIIVTIVVATIAFIGPPHGAR
jgi:hypothetical protein